MQERRLKLEEARFKGDRKEMEARLEMEKMEKDPSMAKDRAMLEMMAAISRQRDDSRLRTALMICFAFCVLTSM